MGEQRQILEATKNQYKVLSLLGPTAKSPHSRVCRIWKDLSCHREGPPVGLMMVSQYSLFASTRDWPNGYKSVSRAPKESKPFIFMVCAHTCAGRRICRYPILIQRGTIVPTTNTLYLSR